MAPIGLLIVLTFLSCRPLAVASSQMSLRRFPMTKTKYQIISCSQYKSPDKSRSRWNKYDERYRPVLQKTKDVLSVGLFYETTFSCAHSLLTHKELALSQVIVPSIVLSWTAASFLKTLVDEVKRKNNEKDRQDDQLRQSSDAMMDSTAGLAKTSADVLEFLRDTGKAKTVSTPRVSVKITNPSARLQSRPLSQSTSLSTAQANMGSSSKEVSELASSSLSISQSTLPPTANSPTALINNVQYVVPQTNLPAASLNAKTVAPIASTPNQPVASSSVPPSNILPNSGNPALASGSAPSSAVTAQISPNPIVSSTASGVNQVTVPAVSAPAVSTTQVGSSSAVTSSSIASSNAASNAIYSVSTAQAGASSAITSGFIVSGNPVSSLGSVSSVSAAQAAASSAAASSSLNAVSTTGTISSVSPAQAAASSAAASSSLGTASISGTISSSANIVPTAASNAVASSSLAQASSLTSSSASVNALGNNLASPASSSIGPSLTTSNTLATSSQILTSANVPNALVSTQTTVPPTNHLLSVHSAHHHFNTDIFISLMAGFQASLTMVEKVYPVTNEVRTRLLLFFSTIIISAAVVKEMISPTAEMSVLILIKLLEVLETLRDAQLSSDSDSKRIK